MDGGRDGRKAAASQETPRAVGHHRKLEEARKNPTSKEDGPAYILTLELCTNMFLLFYATQFVVLCYSNPRILPPVQTRGQYIHPTGTIQAVYDLGIKRGLQQGKVT